MSVPTELEVLGVMLETLIMFVTVIALFYAGIILGRYQQIEKYRKLKEYVELLKKVDAIDSQECQKQEPDQ